MAKALNIHNAEIHTATIDIRTITISGKQMTLSVFRQLQEERLIDDDGQFRGLPWGIVNYHPNSSCSDWHVPHVHVVWQKGSELRRARINDPYGRQEILNLPQLFITV